MPGNKTIWMTDDARANLDALVARWELSDSATIAKALKQARESSDS